MTPLPEPPPRFNVTRGQIVARGLANRCPNCGGRTLFQPGSFFKVNPACPNCGLKIERDEGFFIGSMSLNYGFTTIVFLAPIMVLAYNGVLGTTVATILGIACAFVVPALFYRSSRSLWLMNYYFFLPQHLPANRAPDQKEELT
jgi:DNA-directed RNA polymerase subunit RPC12/RpoP